MKKASFALLACLFAQNLFAQWRDATPAETVFFNHVEREVHEILRDAASSQGISAERYNYIIGQQRELENVDRLMRKEPNVPELPPPGSPPPAVPFNRPRDVPDTAADATDARNP